HLCNELSYRCLPLCVRIVLVDTFLIRLLYGYHGVSREITELRDHLASHLTNTVFDEPGVLVGFHYDVALIAAFKEFIDARAHGILQDFDDLLEADMLVIVGLDAEETPPSLVVRGHRHLLEERFDRVLRHA